MPRAPRASKGNVVYHVLNRANARMQIFGNRADYDALLGILADAIRRTQTRLLAYCLMPNHWHLSHLTPFPQPINKRPEIVELCWRGG